MEKVSSWFRVIITWIVIIPDFVLSYLSLRNPFYNIEVLSLGVNFIAAIVLFYIYMDIARVPIINSDAEGETSEEGEGKTSAPATTTTGGCVCPLYKLTFGPLIEDILTFAGLFILLYNIVPIALWIHNTISSKI